jgi:uncharacterized paraquat-inducible protein A
MQPVGPFYRCENCFLVRVEGDQARCPRCGRRFIEYTPWRHRLPNLTFSVRSLCVAVAVSAAYFSLFDPRDNSRFYGPLLLMSEGYVLGVAVGGLFCSLLLPIIYFPLFFFNKWTVIAAIVALYLWILFGSFLEMLSNA